MIKTAKNMLLVVALVGTCALADIETSGEVSVYGKNVNNSGTTKDSGYSMTSINLNATKKIIDTVSANIGFKSNHKLNEKVDGDYSNGSDPESAMHTANLTYSNSGLTVIAGRQEIDLEWIGDYHEAIVGVAEVIPNTTLTIGHTSRTMAVDSDKALAKMADINGNNGANVVDLLYTLNDKTNVSTYYMNAPDLFSAYGVSVSTELSGFGIGIKYAKSSEDVSTTKDGNILAFNFTYGVNETDLNAGYIVTDKDGAIGSLSTLGDNINPLEEGTQVYGTDASTYYIGINKEISGVALGLLYATTDYINGTVAQSESELNLTLSKELVADTTLDIIYVDISAHNSNSNSNYYSAQITYNF